MQTLRPLTVLPDGMTAPTYDYISAEEAQEIGRNMSKILDKILANYTSRQRPFPNGGLLHL